MPFIVKGTPRYFAREKLDVLAEAGLAWVNLGLQSGSDRVCGEVYGRRITNEEFLTAARLINEYSVAAYYDVIVDNPYERAEESLETVEVLLRTPRPFYTLIFSLSVYYGTDLHASFIRDFPARADEALGKDYRFRERSQTTVLIEMAGVLHRPFMRALIRMFRRQPQTLVTRAAMNAAKLYTTTFLLPLTYFRLILRTQKGSIWRAIRVLPVYLHGGLTYHANNFDWFKALMRPRGFSTRDRGNARKRD